MEAVRRFERLALGEGAAVSRVEASGPWHCSLVRGAAKEIARDIQAIRCSPPKFPVYVAVKGGREDDPEALRLGLAEQIHRPVLWQPVIRRLLGEAELLVEVGPGHILTGFARAATGRSSEHGLFAVELRGGRISRLALGERRTWRGTPGLEKGDQACRSF
jgi:[acyl-carrier-protein] S-malonyltransferase